MSVPHMTLDEFLEALTETGGGWTWSEWADGKGGVIRRFVRRSEDCPITAVANDRRTRNRRYRLAEVSLAAESLGLLQHKAEIIDAADGYRPRAKLVRRLRKAVGL